MPEKATLIDVENNGELLLLKDGRRLKIGDPDDATVASIWMPPLTVTLHKRKGRGDGLSVTNEDTGETISASAAKR
jgi:hypothetical protein